MVRRTVGSSITARYSRSTAAQSCVRDESLLRHRQTHGDIVRIQREGLCECLIRVDPGVVRRLEPAADHPAVSVGDRHVRVEKVRIFFCGQLEQPYRFEVVVLGLALHQKPALQKQLVGFGVVGAKPAQPRLLLSRQAQPQPLGDRQHHAVLDPHEIGKRPVERLTPEAFARRAVNQLSGHDNLGAATRQRARNHGAHAKRARGLPRVRIAFEAHHGGASLHLQRLGTGEVINQPVGEAVGDVFDVRVLGAAFERQHRDRVECRLARAVPSIPEERTGRDGEDHRCEDGESQPRQRPPCGGRGDRIGERRSGRSHGGGGFRYQRVERSGELARRREALLRGLRQTSADHSLKGVRRIGTSGGQRRRLVTEDGRQGLDGRRALERALAGEHLVDDGAERELVGSEVDVPSRRLLGGHVADGSENGPGDCADVRRPWRATAPSRMRGPHGGPRRNRES